MQVDMSQLSPYMAYALRQAIAQGGAPSLTEYVPEAAPAADSSVPGGSAANGETGSASGAGLLAAKTAQLLMQMYQALPSNQAPPDPSAPPPLVPPAEQRFDLAIGMVDSVASCTDDPATAAVLTKSMTMLTLVPLSINPLRNQPPGGGEYAKNLALANSIRPQLQAIYGGDKAQGKSDAQALSDMYSLQLSQPDSYWNARDPYHLSGDQKEMTRIQLEVLDMALAQSRGGTGSQGVSTPAG